MVSAPAKQKLRVVKQPLPPKLKEGEVIILPDYCEAINEGGYFKEYRKLAERYKLLGMTDRQYNYIRIVTRAQQGPGLPYIGLEAIADKMGKSYFTAYEIRKELLDAGFMVMRDAYHPEHQKMVQVHDLTAFYQMNIGLNDKELNKEAVSIYRAILENRSEMGRQAAKKRYDMPEDKDENEDAEDAEDAPKHDFVSVKNAISRQLKSLKMRLIENARTVSTGQSNATSDFGIPQEARQEQTQTEIESNHLAILPTIDSSNLSKQLEEESLVDNSPGYTNHSQNQQPSNDSSINSIESKTSVPTQTNEIENTNNRNNRKSNGEGTGGAKQAGRETKYKRLVAIYGKAEQPLPMVFHQIVEDFSREMGDEAPKSTMTQVANIYNPLGREGISDEDFIRVLYDARTKAQEASIKKMTTDARRMKRIVYFIEALAKRAVDTLEYWRQLDEQRQGNPYEQ